MSRQLIWLYVRRWNITRKKIPVSLLSKYSPESVSSERSRENHHRRVYGKGCIFSFPFLFFFFNKTKRCAFGDLERGDNSQCNDHCKHHLYPFSSWIRSLGYETHSIKKETRCDNFLKLSGIMKKESR